MSANIVVLQKDETDQRKIIFAINQAIQWINTNGGSGGGGGASGGDGAGGRLTLVSGNPVMSNILNPGVSSSIIYYTPYKGPFVPVWNGTSWSGTDMGGELSQALSDATKSPAAGVLNTLYDMFVWADGSTMRCTRGDAWASLIARASPLAINDGVVTNGTNITNGPLAGTGVYVGTIKVGPVAVSCAFHPPKVGPDADGVSFGEIDIWNFYNRINFAGSVQINTLSNWSWPSTFWRQAGGFGSYAFFYVCGIDEDFINARYDVMVNAFVGPDIGYAGIGVDTTSTPSGVQAGAGISGTGADVTWAPACGIYAGNPGIGFHFVCAIESTSGGTGDIVYYGAANGGLTVNWKF